jgi:peptidoglycan/xylan/chitin deacetylase (PgdA/CDA1 family)
MRAILMYHSLDTSGSPISVAPGAFRAHMLALISRGVAVMGIAELLSAPANQHAVAITFDDALASVGEVARPVLAELGLTATVFVPTAHVAGDNRWRGTGDRGVPHSPVLSWEQLGDLQDCGWTIGAHTRTHTALTRCSAAQIDDELEGSAQDILRVLGVRPQLFAYPYGRTNAQVSAAASAVFDVSVTTEMRALTASEVRAEVPRIDACYFRANGMLRAWGSPQQRAYVTVRGALRSLKQSMTDD